MTAINKSSKIYVAGHRGLVGSAIVRKLSEKGYGNIITRTHAQLDLSRQLDTERFFDAERPEYVFLAAAKVGGILANNTYKADFIYDNLAIATNVIHASHGSGVKKLLNLGSSCIYPKYAPQPMKENMLLTSELEPTNEAYAIAKIAAIKLCRYFNEQYGTNFISVMPTNLYGPNDNFDLMDSHVLPAIMRKMHLARLLTHGDYGSIVKDFLKFGNAAVAVDNREITIHSNSTKDDICKVLDFFGIRIEQASGAVKAENREHEVSLTLWGSGSPFREFLHADDLAESVIMLMENCDYSETGEFVNIGSGTDLSIRDLAGIVKETVGFTGRLLFDSTKPDGTPKKLLDVTKIHDLGWKHSIELREGIRHFYRWYCES